MSVFFIAGIKTSAAGYGAVDDGSADAQVDSVNAEPNPASVVDEVVWVVGDEAILLSDVENVKMQSEMDGMKWDGNPDCLIPEQLAVQKLFLHQAAIDSVEVTESDVARSVE